MKILAIDSSTALGSVALLENNNLIGQLSSMRAKSHSEFLNSAVEKLLAESNTALKQIDLFATSTGPGSFTGLRVAGNIAKTFAYSLSKKMYAAESLAALGYQAKFPPLSLAMINAHKNMVYVSAFINDQNIYSARAVGIEQLESDLTELIATHKIQDPQFQCLGDGYSEYFPQFTDKLKQLLIAPQEGQVYPEAKTLAEMAATGHKLGQTIEWNLFQPLYIRASSAEENKRNN